MNFNIHLKRTVNGDPTDPTSTRDITGLNQNQFDLLWQSLEQAELEAHIMKQVPDEALQEIATQHDFWAKKAGYDQLPEGAFADANAIRSYFDARAEIITTLQEKFMEAVDSEQDGLFSVIGFSPKQFENLIISAQSALKEVSILNTLEPEQVPMAIEATGEIVKGHGLELPGYYKEYIREGYLEERIMGLSEVLIVVNEPYQQSEYRT